MSRSVDEFYEIIRKEIEDRVNQLESQPKKGDIEVSVGIVTLSNLSMKLALSSEQRERIILLMEKAKRVMKEGTENLMRKEK